MTGVPSSVRFRGEVSTVDAANTLVELPGDVAVVMRGKPRWLVIRCPDGCGEILRVNLDAASGKAWRIYGSQQLITVFPSIWRDSGCRSHFIIWDGALYMSGAFRPPTSAAMDAAVLAAIDSGVHTATAIAERLDESVWIVAGTLGRLEQRDVLIQKPRSSGNYVRRSQ